MMNVEIVESMRGMTFRVTAMSSFLHFQCGTEKMGVKEHTNLLYKKKKSLHRRVFS